MYGSTEAEPISSILAEELLDYYNLNEFQGLAVGSIHHYSNVKIIPALDHELHKLNEIELENLELKQNSIGEIIVKGPHVLRNYLDNEIAEKQNKIITEKSVWQPMSMAVVASAMAWVYFLSAMLASARRA